VVVDFCLVFKERFGVKVGFGANFLPGIVSSDLFSDLLTKSARFRA
jgi:hypothetical protein